MIKMNITKLAKKSARNLSPYAIPAQSNATCKLNQNESPYSIPQIIMNKITKRIINAQINRYNDTNSTQLKKLLAVKLNIESKRIAIAIGAGIDELFYYLTLAFVEKGDKILRFSPSFDMYRICSTISEAKDVEIPLNKDFSLPEEFEEESKNAKLVFICRPNNPTGNAIPLEIIERIVKSASGIVCIDEAYAEFANDNCMRLLDYKNVIIMRTFSKAFSAAGIRVGYALANKKIIEYINRVKLPWNISIFSQIAAEEIIANSELFEQRINKIKEERTRIVKEMEKLGICVFPSQANFLLFKLNNADKVFDKLLKQGVLVRPFSTWTKFHNFCPRWNFRDSNTIKNYLRVSIGTKNENNSFLKALKRCVK